MVSATDAQNVKFVQELNGKPVKIKYQKEAYFSQDLARHIYTKGYDNVGLTDFSFEIDDDGNPYWVVSMYKRTIGVTGNDVVGVLTVNPETGEIKDYSVENAPKWIDRIQPESFISTQLNNHLSLKGGFLNSIFAKKGVLKITSDNLSLVTGKDGQSYWYTGITSAGSDESTTGFVLVNTKTKEAKYYTQPGATEYASVKSLEGKFPEKNYTASEPI